MYFNTALVTVPPSPPWCGCSHYSATFHISHAHPRGWSRNFMSPSRRHQEERKHLTNWIGKIVTWWDGRLFVCQPIEDKSTVQSHFMQACVREDLTQFRTSFKTHIWSLLNFWDLHYFKLCLWSETSILFYITLFQICIKCDCTVLFSISLRLLHLKYCYFLSTMIHIYK
jgi:hypothetical protein